MDRAGRLIGKLNVMQDVADPDTRAVAAWAVAAGKKIARHSKARSLVRKTLVVEVEDQVWQRQLATLSQMLLRNLEKALGERLVEALDFRPMPARRPQERADTARPGGDRIEDPVLAMLYRRARGNGS